MKRLIDATDLVKQLKACTMSNGTLINTNTMIAVIEKSPTAYDMEKVMEQLEELANHYHKCCLVDYNEGAEVGIRESMAIVRKGGVER